MTVSIERSIFKQDGFPKGKIFQSAKAAVPRKGNPEQVSADLQVFIRAELTRLEAQENGNGKAKAPVEEMGGMAILGAGKGAPQGEAPKEGGQAEPAGAPAPGPGIGPKAEEKNPTQAPPQSPPPAKASPAPGNGDEPCTMTDPQKKKIYAMENHKRAAKEVITGYLHTHNHHRLGELSRKEASQLIDILGALQDEQRSVA